MYASGHQSDVVYPKKTAPRAPILILFITKFQFGDSWRV